MHAIVYRQAGSIDREDALVGVELEAPIARGYDLLVEVRAVSVNPADTKLRAKVAPQNGQRVLGFDAAGVVRTVGPDVTLFRPGGEVFYAGDVNRSGTDAELHLVDERIVGRKPSSLSWAEEAALPLTTLTAWEALCSRRVGDRVGWCRLRGRSDCPPTHQSHRDRDRGRRGRRKPHPGSWRPSRGRPPTAPRVTGQKACSRSAGLRVLNDPQRRAR